MTEEEFRAYGEDLKKHLAHWIDVAIKNAIKMRRNDPDVVVHEDEVASAADVIGYEFRMDCLAYARGEHE